MKDTQRKRMIARWFLPFGILLLLVVFMVVNFSVKSKESGKKNVEEALKVTAERYAEKVDNELQVMTASGMPMSSLMSLYTKDDIRESFRVANVLQQNTSAYQVILCNLDGMGMAHDYSMDWVDLSETDYFEEVLKAKEQTYIYTEDDGYLGEEAIVSAIPMYKQGNLGGYLLLYYRCSEFANLIEKAEFDSNAFYAVVDDGGTVICSAGDVKSSLFSETDFYNNLLEKGDNAKAVDKINKWIRNQMTGIQSVVSQTEKRELVFAPLGMNRWYMIIGINESYINSLEEQAWDNAKRMLIQLMTVIIIFSGILVVVSIVSRVRASEESKALEDKADTDLLTELNNKIATERKIKEYLKENPNVQAMMFVLDIDNFKKINDTKGHVFGDEVLRTLGMRIKAEFRMSDIIGRTGGDEFTIFLKNVKDEALIAREGKRVENFFKNFQAGDYVKYSVTASIGVAVYPRDGSGFEELYKAADHALYIAKRRGKNQLAFYGDSKENI